MSILETKERDALALLIIGASFEEARVLSGLSLKQVMELWQQRQKAA